MKKTIFVGLFILILLVSGFTIIFSLNQKDSISKNSKPPTTISNKDENSTTKAKEENTIEEPIVTMELEKTTNVTTTTTTKANKTNTTKNTTSSKKTSTSKTVSTTTSTKKTSTTTTTKSYIGVPDPNNFNYSIHHGKIDLKVNGNNEDEVRAECVMKAKLIAVKDTVDIINTNCIDVMDSENNLLGFYILVKCSSGNCNRYKN